MEQISSSLRANISVKPSGMCCTITRVPGKSPGSCDSTYCKACGPPVETPIATTRDGFCFPSRTAFATGRVALAMDATRTPLLCAAALILAISSLAISGMRAETSCGLATKSNAPSDSALSVMEAPSVL
jgi:hypothetical protein